MTTGRLQVKRIGQPRALGSDLYHLVHTVNWWVLFSFFALNFVLLNFLFAALLSLDPGCVQGARPDSFSDHFFFSVQSMTTIGYGHMSPANFYANILVTAEAFLGIFSTALMTGIVFAKFSLPKARVVFASSMILGRRDGKDCLMFRVANGRGNSLISVNLQATLIISDETTEGETTRRIIPLPLKVPNAPVLTISLLGVHVIDEHSPLHGLSLADLKARYALVAVTVWGTDETIGQLVHAQYFYRAPQILQNVRYKDVLEMGVSGEEFEYIMDYAKLHEVEPVPAN